MKNKNDIKKIEFQKFCKDEFDKCVERIRKRMQKDEFRVSTYFDFIMTEFPKNSISKQVFADDKYRSELEWSPYRIIGKLVNDYIDYDYDPICGDIRFNIVHKDEILKRIDEFNEKQEKKYKEHSAKIKEQEYKMYLKLKKKYEKNTEKKA